MALLDLWKKSPSELQTKAVRQLIALAGNGKLADGNPTSSEFRTLLTAVPSKLLAAYAEQCLVDSFQDGGLALQDIINEIGRRLGFQVRNGLYRGKSGAIGNDGLWFLSSNHHIIVEVKTTDAYRIDLNAIAGYQTALAASGTLSEGKSSVLIVVGRTDTGDLEAQIRGSRHAWNMRLVSIDALTRLMFVKESVEDPETLSRIHQILLPHEFTKLDAIVDLVFSAAEDAKSEEPDGTEEGGSAIAAKVAKVAPVTFNEACAELVSKHLSVPLVRRTKATYSSPDDALRVICLVSRKHGDGKAPFWFAFHPHQKNELESASQGYVAFGCGTPKLVFLIPINAFSAWLEGMNVTTRKNGFYWHVHILEEAGKAILVRKKGQNKIDISQYRLHSNS